MPTTILKIKNMVCSRCGKVVKGEFDKLGYKTTVEQLGNAIIEKDFERESIRLS